MLKEKYLLAREIGEKGPREPANVKEIMEKKDREKGSPKSVYKSIYVLGSPLAYIQMSCNQEV